MSGRRKAGKQGFALVLVLGFLLLLSIIVGSLIQQSRSLTTSSNARIRGVKADYLAEAALNRAVLGLLARDPAKRWKPDGSGKTFSLDGQEIKIRVEPEAKRLDLNNAPPEALEALFTSKGIGKEAALGLANRIADWRDTDDLLHTQGAERGDHQMKGIANAPANGPFHSVEEVKKVLDFPGAYYPCLEPHLTVYSGSNSFRTQPATSEQKSASTSRSAAMAIGGSTYRVLIEIPLAKDTAAHHFAVIRLTDNAARPYDLLEFGTDGRKASPSDCAKQAKPKAGQ